MKIAFQNFLHASLLGAIVMMSYGSKLASLIESTVEVSREHLYMSTTIFCPDLKLKIYCIRENNYLC
jgi:hypothetical protein